LNFLFHLLFIISTRMTTFSAYGGVPTPGFTGVGFAGGFPGGVAGGIAPGFGVDIDPITPGVQTQRGTLTATGPSTLVGGGMLSSGLIGGAPIGLQSNLLASGIARSGFQQNFVGGGLVDADPITPGIQAQPGVVTPIGPPTVVSSGARGGTFGFGGPVIDADPLTPGIQAQPGVITATGPSTVVGNVNGTILGGGFQQQGFQTIGGGIIDADPLTPGIQAQPGVITATGPSVVVGYGNQPQCGNCCGGNLGYPNQSQCGNCCGGNLGYPNQSPCGCGNICSPYACSNGCRVCPWWLWPLLGLLLLGGLIGGLYAFLSKRNSSS
jgi:hypothetical protein